MEKTELIKTPDNKLTLFTMGLRMDVQPYWLVKGMISKNSQDILDEMIISQYRALLSDFLIWQTEVISHIPDGDEDAADVEFVKYMRDVHVKQIQDIADFSRNLLDLHSDYQAVITEEDEEAAERAYEYWRYNEFYGYEKIEK